MALREFLTDIGNRDKSLIVANRTAPEPLQVMLERLFTEQSIQVDEHQIPALDDNLVLLVEDGDVVATSPLQAVEEMLLMINSDAFITGTYGLSDIDLPDVLRDLDELLFRLRGYPHSNKEKLLLILISRYIERLAWNHDGGRLRASFQRLSRMEDEMGTLRVYEQLAASNTETHVYGVADREPPITAGLTTHAGDTPDYRDSWFVVFDSGERPETPSLPPAAGLLAIQEGPGEWLGYWTFSPETVTALDTHIATTL